MELKSEKAFRIADLILRYQEGTVSEEEMEELRLWLKKSPEHQQQFENLNDRDYIRRKRELDLSINPAAAYTVFSKKVTRECPRSYRKLHRLAAVAALFLIVVGGYWYWFREDWNADPVPQVLTTVIPAGGNKAVLTLANGEQIHLQGDSATSIKQQDGTVAEASAASLVYQNGSSLPEELLYNSLSIPRKGEFTLVLSDGTKIWLNSESKVEYPTVFSPGERKVCLQGEAYFQVAPDKSSPFIIEMGNVQVQVLGTSFNLRAYQDEDVIQTTLVEGSVCMFTDKRRILLSPNEQGYVDLKTGNLDKKQVDVQAYIGWKNGRFIFERQTLEDIMRTLSRWYDVQVVFQSEKARHIEFTGNLRRYDNFGQIVSMLALACPAKFNVSGTTIYIAE